MGLNVGEVDGVWVLCSMCNWLETYMVRNDIWQNMIDIFDVSTFCFPHLCRLR